MIDTTNRPAVPGNGEPRFGYCAGRGESRHDRRHRSKASATRLRERLVDDAKALLQETLKAVLRLGHNHVGTEHLLFGALLAGEDAGTTLNELAVTAEGVETAITAELARIQASKT